MNMTDNNTEFENNNMSEHDDMLEEYYKVTINNNTFQILKLFSDNYRQYTILDNRGRDCVNVSIQLRRDVNRAYLSQVLYRPTCTIGETMIRGLSTVNMVKALLIMVMRDTDFDKIYLKDKSEIDCVLPDEESTVYKISLGLLSFILNGQTWYQKHFGAIPISEQRQTQMDVFDTKLMSEMTHSAANELKNKIKESLKNYPRSSWRNTVFKTVKDIILTNIGKSWRSVFFELFSDKGLFSKTMSANMGCLLFEFSDEFIEETFNPPDLKNINMYITRETILAYPEAHIEIVKDESPFHIDKTRKNMLLKSSMLFNGTSVYMVGGKKTLKFKNIRYMPSEYGRNLIGYMNRRKSLKGTRKLRQ